MSEKIDLVNRDPYDINQHLKVAFEDVLGEPEGAKSIDCVWKYSYTCYNCGKNCCYKFLTLLCGLCIALYWGCEFAMVTFQHVWCLTPWLRELSICCGFLQRGCGTIVNCFIAPCCEACGMLFSGIVMTSK